MVIIFGDTEDRLAAEVHQELARRGTSSLLLPAPAPSSPFKFSWQLPDAAPCSLRYGSHAVDIREIEGILVRALPEIPPDIPADSNDHYLRVEWHAAMVGWLQSVPATVIDRPRPGPMLSLPILPAFGGAFRSCGLPLAEVMVTDSAEEGAAFVRASGYRVRQTPGLTGDAAPVGEELLEDTIRSLVCVSPGLRRRIHVAGGDVMAEMVRGDTAGDCRWAADHALPAELATACCALAARLGLQFVELEVVTGEAGHEVIGAAELADATFADPAHRTRVAAALAEALVSRGREVPL